MKTLPQAAMFFVGLEIYFIGGVNPAFQRRPVAARQFFVGKEIYITGRACALPSNQS
jgi:hypothetical protein